MSGRGRLAAYAELARPRDLARRTNILVGTFRDHQFERTSPLEPLPAALTEGIYRNEVTLPPFRHLNRPGTQTIPGLIFLISLGRAIGARTVFEIGTFIGLSAWTLARNLPEAEVHTLDLPVTESPALELEPTDVEHRVSAVERHVYAIEPHEGTVVQHWGDSATFDFTPWSGACDLVYIDGAHSEPYVRSDTDNARVMLSENGAIVWDDYWRQVRGVPAVLNGLDDLSVYRVPGTRLAVHLTGRAAAAARRSE